MRWRAATQELSKSKNIVHKDGQDKIDKRLVVHIAIREKEIWRNGIRGSRFLMAGLTLIRRGRCLDGSGSREALDYSERRDGQFITC